MLWVAVGLNWDRPSFDHVWAESRARDPLGRTGYVPALQYLSHKWHGSHDDMYALVDAAPAIDWAAVLPLQAHLEFVLQETSTKQMGLLEHSSFWEHPSRVRDLDLAVGWARRRPTHPLALHDLSVVAYSAVQANRWADAAEVFGVCGHRSTEYPWYHRGDPAAELAKAHAKVMKGAGSRRFWTAD